MTKPTILVVGSAMMDLTLNMARIPEHAEVLTDDGGVAYLPAGSAVELSLAIDRLGACAVPVTKLGADSHGRRLYDFLKSRYLDLSAVTVDRELPSALSVRMRESTGAERRLIYPGACAAIGPDMIRHAFDLVNPTAVLIALDVPFESVLCAARVAESRGIPIFLEGRGASAEHTLESLPPVELFSLNEQEAKTYTDVLPLGADASLRSALILWKKVKMQYVLLKLGSRGSFLYDGKRRDIISPVAGCRVPEGSACLGAVYTAALVNAYLSGTEIRTAMRFATDAAALCAQNGGGIGAFPTAREIIEYESARNEIES